MVEYVSATEAAQLLGRSESYIRKCIGRGDLDATKVEGSWRIARADLNVPPGTPDGTHGTHGVPPGTSEVPLVPSNGTHGTHGTHGVPAVAPDWRDDLLAQVARLEADKVAAGEREGALREDVSRVQQDMGLRLESSKARIIDLERELTVRDSRTVDLQAKQELEVTELRGQVAVLEAKVREVLEKGHDILEKGQDEALQLANRIADLVDRQQEAEARIHELAPVAEQVPMLQAAVEEKDATLSQREQALQDTEQELGNMRQDIDAIASRPVTGPVFRLLTKGRLRR